MHDRVSRMTITEHVLLCNVNVHSSQSVVPPFGASMRNKIS